jgi:hypothetical protein
MAAGIATLVSGYRIGLTAAALVSAAGAVAVALTLPPPTTGARRPVAPQRDNR